MRRLPGRCYFCGDPTVSEWFCATHLWAEGLATSVKTVNGLEKVTREHAFWIERFTPEQIVELASHIDQEAAA